MPKAKTGGARGARRSRPVGAGGRRLAKAFEAVARLPVLADLQSRTVRLAARQAASSPELVEAVESDAALAIAMLRAANNGSGPSGRAGSVQEAVEALQPDRVGEIAGGLDSYDVLDSPGMLAERYERFRRHGVATQAAADQIAEWARVPRRDELAVAALLHDVGRLVMIELYGDPSAQGAAGETPEARVGRERRELGIDHALVGSVLVRRWGLRPGIALAIERHHSRDAEGHAAVIRLADLVVHYGNGGAVTGEVVATAAVPLELGPERLRTLLYEFPATGPPRRRPTDPCPLSNREMDALKGLAEGKVYKQIAHELELSVSTIRTHLHNVYRKIGAVDRAQAVLIASDRGWI